MGGISRYACRHARGRAGCSQASELGRLMPPQTDEAPSATPTPRSHAGSHPAHANAPHPPTRAPRPVSATPRRRPRWLSRSPRCLRFVAAVAACLVPVGRRSSRRAGVPLLRSRFVSTGRRREGGATDGALDVHAAPISRARPRGINNGHWENCANIPNCGANTPNCASLHV